MSRHLLSAGHRVSMICGIADVTAAALNVADQSSVLAIDGIEVHRIAAPYSNRMGFARRLLSFGQFARKATSIVRKLDADIVFATSTPLTVGIPGMKSACKLGAPFVFEVRDLWPEVPIAIGVLKNPLLIWYARRLERKIYRAAQHIIALSPGMKEGIVKAGYPAERVTMIPNGADLELFRPAGDPLDDVRFGAPDDFRLVFTGAHGLANGLDAVLDAATELKRRGETGIRFVFIGTGKEKSRLVARCLDEALDSLVTWMDPIQKRELARILPRMDVGMMILKNLPAFYYGTSPNKFFDYTASGLPVLCNYPGWMAEMIVEHRCGIAVAPDNPSAFADAVVRLRDQRTERRAMGTRARALAESRFDRRMLAEQFVAVLEEAHRDWNSASRT